MLGVAFAVFWVYGHRAHLRALGGARFGGYSPVAAFRLHDSLPALEGGLSNLEAFTVRIAPAWRADADRSIWLSAAPATLTLEFISQKARLDSVTLFAAATGRAPEARTFKGGQARDVRWTVALRPHGEVGPTWRRHLSLDGWREVVVAYLSDPPLLRFHAEDRSVRVFERAEGTVLHAVSGWYLARDDASRAPDTAYALESAASSGDELRLAARGTALAVINPTANRVRLKLLETGSTRSEAVEAAPYSVSVFRAALRNRKGLVLAFTAPGEPFPVWRRRGAAPREFFVLRP